MSCGTSQLFLLEMFRKVKIMCECIPSFTCVRIGSFCSWTWPNSYFSSWHKNTLENISERLFWAGQKWPHWYLTKYKTAMKRIFKSKEEKQNKRNESSNSGNHFQGSNSTIIQPVFFSNRRCFLIPMEDQYFLTNCLLCQLKHGMAVFLHTFLDVTRNVTWSSIFCRLPADVKTAVYTVGAQTSEGWDFLLSKYQHHSFSVDKDKIASALSLTRNKDKLQWWVVCYTKKAR